EANEGLRGRKRTQNVVPLVVNSGPTDLQQANVVRTGVPAQLTEPCCIELVRGRSSGGLFVERLHCGMFGQFHDALLWLYMQLYGQEKSALRLRLRQPQLADRFVEQGDAVCTQELRRLSLRRFPGRDRTFEELFPLAGQAERLSSSILA